MYASVWIQQACLPEEHPFLLVPDLLVTFAIVFRNGKTIAMKCTASSCFFRIKLGTIEASQSGLLVVHKLTNYMLVGPVFLSESRIVFGNLTKLHIDNPRFQVPGTGCAQTQYL